MSTSPGEPIILAFDSAGAACSAAIAAGERVLAARRRTMAHGHAEALLPMIEQAMREAGVSAQDLNLVAATIGPGGFTGLRVGLAAARGIALASGVPLFGISGFEAVAAALPITAENGFLLVALESRREELFVQLFDGERRPLAAATALPAEALGGIVAEAIGETPLTLAGDAALRAAAALGHRPGWHIEEAEPDALGVVRAAARRWRSGLPSEPARPLYLRSPDVTLSTAAPGRRDKSVRSPPRHRPCGPR